VTRYKDARSTERARARVDGIDGVSFVASHVVVDAEGESSVSAKTSGTDG
jgi:hypothetical protein